MAIDDDAKRQEAERRKEELAREARQAEQDRLVLLAEKETRDKAAERERMIAGRAADPGPAERLAARVAVTDEAAARLREKALGTEETLSLPPREETPRTEIATENELTIPPFRSEPMIGPGPIKSRTTVRRETFVQRQAREEENRVAALTPEQQAEELARQ